MACLTLIIKRRRCRGFTLIEGLLASMVLALAMVAIGGALTSACQQSSFAQEESAGLALARQLLETVTSVRYQHLHTYQGYSDTTANLKMQDGTAVRLGDEMTYRRSVAIEYRATRDGPPVAQGPFALVTVRVIPNSGHQVQLSKLMVQTN